MTRDIRKVILSLSVVEGHRCLSCHGGLNYTYLTMRAFSSIQGRGMLMYIQNTFSFHSKGRLEALRGSQPCG